jgi:hypothetical protein
VLATFLFLRVYNKVTDAACVLMVTPVVISCSCSQGCACMYRSVLLHFAPFFWTPLAVTSFFNVSLWRWLADGFLGPGMQLRL